MKPSIVFEIRFVGLLLSFLLIGPQFALAQLRVEAGSTGNKAILSIHNDNESVIENVQIEVFKSPESVENVTFNPSHIPKLAAGKSQDIEIEFGIREDALPCGSGELEFLITSSVGMFDDPTPGLLLQIVPRLNPEKILLKAFPVKSEAPDDFPVQNAINYCDLEREPSEYDRVAVFFTLPYDVSEPYDDKCPFMWRILGPNGNTQKGGSSAFAPKHSEPTFAKNGSPGRFVAVLDLWRPGDSRDTAKARSGPGTYTLQIIPADYGATGTFGQGEATIVIATTGRNENGEPIAAEWENVKTFEIKPSRLYFQGFVIEQVKNAWLPDRDDLWEGKLTVDDPKINGSTVTIGAEAWIRKARRDGTGRRPEGEVHRASTLVKVDFPEELAPGHDEMGDIHSRIEPGEKGEFLLTAGMHLMIPTVQLPPDRHLVERGAVPAPWANKGALPEDYCQTFGTGYERFKSAEYSGDGGDWVWQRTPLPRGCDKKEAAELDVRTMLLSGGRNQIAGDPERTLLGHLNDSNTRWVIPVFINLTDEARVRDYSRSLELKTYGYAIYATEPGTYVGPLPKDRPPVGDGPDSEPESQDADRDDSGDEDTTGPGGGTDTDEEREVDPNILDPQKEDVSSLIREWITTARPPEKAVEGNNVRYSGKGNIIGTVVGGIIESRHETGEVDPVFLWTNRRLLDSVDHCTMEEFVVARLKNVSISHCAGRYGAVKNLKGLRLADARAVVTGAGFEYSLVPGSPAKTPEEEGKVEKQEPGPEHFLRKGQSIRLTIHAPYVPKTVTLPDFIGKPLAEARKWIEQNELKSSLQPGSPAPAAALSGAVEKQEPAAGTEVAKGSTVTLTIHSAHVDLRSVPDVHGLAQDAARSRMEATGLVMDRRDAGRPAESRLANTVNKQDPAPGTSIAKGSAVVVWVYGQYTPSREERVAATDCSHYPGSRAYWDETVGGPRCGCFDGLVWNLATSHCVTADVRANEICARDMPGTSARGRTAEGKINCVCPDGQFWNVSQRRCERQLTPQEICDRDVPGTTARGKTPEGKINCVCPDGQFWSASQRKCERQLSPREICEQHYPGSVPTGKDASGRVNCDCPQGYVWADNPRRCIKGDSSRCEEYARTVVAQYQQNLANRCGFTGARWSDDYQGHYGWCLTNSQALADSETHARANELNRCIRDASRCEHYARTAVAQFQQNLANQCGFTGARWSSDYQGHYGWCLTNSQAGAASETQARTEGLNRCIASPTPTQRN
jgi:beta-lactam-binding protein with PASTA domain